ncbi:contractile injection system tape measure protein [Pedobacter sp. B4-66]|uniref:contractile injection system tape measure protein n=1 Tax=Pedobacter sp. B4-66 TaxID=2817280 RepID=UPI001BDA3C11|nr:contractile injection system tape measure protein [Pedobacter sp. B4-66]
MQHVIKKQTIDLLVDKQLDSFSIQQQVSDHFLQYLVPLLEREFDKLSVEDEVISLDQIEIDLGVIQETEINKMGWDGDLLETIGNQVKDLMLQEIGSVTQPLVKLSSAANSFRQWFFYMRNGYLPWNATTVDKEWYDRVIEELATNYNSVTELRKEIIGKLIMVTRIIRQHSPTFLIRLVEILTAEKQTKLLTVITKVSNKKAEEVSGSPLMLYEKLWQEILKISASGSSKNTSSQLLELAKQYQTYEVPTADKEIDAKTWKDLKSENRIIVNKGIVNEGIYAQYAGLILIHPFLNSLFKQLGLLAGKLFAGIEEQEKAIYLLHYVATAETNVEEYELVLPKILCGYPVDLPVNTGIKLSGRELEEAEDMLQAAIASWDILKSTSPQGLRESFLQRNGKVLVHNERISIQVEKSAIDVLLDHLPWNLSIIKLPWLDEILKVEWR